MELLTTYLELVTCTKRSRGRQICWYLSSGTKPKRQEQDFDQQRLLLAVGQHLSLDIMCEGQGTQVKQQQHIQSIQPSPSPYRHPTTIIPFSSSVLFSASTNICITTVHDGPQLSL